jgi:23S rRNA pseudouridine1911/1915/1917 synthase
VNDAAEELPRRFEVMPEDAGERVDRWLSARFPDHSRTQIQRWIQDGLVTVDGAPPRASHAVEAGEVFFVVVPPASPTTLEPRPLALDVIYEDDDLAVLLKPPGLVVHPGAGADRTTLAHGLLARWPGWDPPGSFRRPGIVHRLDRDTSGLLVVARTQRAYLSLVRQISAREVTRRYIALCWGELDRDAGQETGPIGRDPRDRRRMAVRHDGRPAVTNWRVLRRFDMVSLLDIALGTGRTHQVRVHLSHAGHPVFGDPGYGGTGAWLNRVGEERRAVMRGYLQRLGRQALHAYHLTFRHPAGGGTCRFEVPVPADMEAVLDGLTAEEESR